MKAAVLRAPNEPFEITDRVEIDAPPPGRVRVRVAACGVCHSDLSIADGTFPSPLPIVLGHEAAGIVDAVGEGISDLAPGDHVVLTPCPPCGRCYGCLRGEPGVCVEASAIQSNTFPDGSTGLFLDGARVYRGVGMGGFAEQVLVPATGAVRIDPDIPLDVACVIGCAVQTGVGAALNTARVEEGATVLVMGLGGVGLSIVQGARLAGAARIIVADPVAERRAAGARFGATDVIDPTREDVAARTVEITGVGADYAFDAVGRSSLVQAGLWATRPGGTTIAVGAMPLDDAVTISPMALFTIAEKKLIGCTLGSSNSLREIPRLLALWRAGRLDLEGLITRRRPLAEVDAAMDDLKAGRGIRTVLVM